MNSKKGSAFFRQKEFQLEYYECSHLCVICESMIHYFVSSVKFVPSNDELPVIILLIWILQLSISKIEILLNVGWFLE